MRAPKLRTRNRPTASTATTTRPIAKTSCTSGDMPERKLQKPAARPSSTIAKRSKTRSMKIVPKARLSGHAVIDLDEIGAVDVAQLGRHETVDQPADEDDLGRVAQLIVTAGASSRMAQR